MLADMIEHQQLPNGARRLNRDTLPAGKRIGTEGSSTGIEVTIPKVGIRRRSMPARLIAGEVTAMHLLIT
jgi:hypothetical protein